MVLWRRNSTLTSLDDRVRPQTEEEKQLYKLLSKITNRPASLLSSRWREPSFTIHNVEISGPKSEKYPLPSSTSLSVKYDLDATVIPGTVAAQLSLRLVPDQDLDTIVRSLRDYLQRSFEGLQSPNKLVVRAIPKSPADSPGDLPD